MKHVIPHPTRSVKHSPSQDAVGVTISFLAKDVLYGRRVLPMSVSPELANAQGSGGKRSQPFRTHETMGLRIACNPCQAEEAHQSR